MSDDISIGPIEEQTEIVIPAYTTALEMFNAIVDAGQNLEINHPFSEMLGLPKTVHRWNPTFKPGDMRELAMYLLAYSAARNSEETEDDD